VVVAAVAPAVVVAADAAAVGVAVKGEQDD